MEKRLTKEQRHKIYKLVLSNGLKDKNVCDYFKINTKVAFRFNPLFIELSDLYPEFQLILPRDENAIMIGKSEFTKKEAELMLMFCIEMTR